MLLEEDRPQSRGKTYYPTPGETIIHPKQGDKVGFRVGDQWILYEVIRVNTAPHPGCGSGGLYTLTRKEPQPHFKGDNVITATREQIQFPPEVEGVLEWDIVVD
ncbi:unnamed protein product [Rhizoctonia solani]|uniref:Uncharacterized protein n=1 Tax=Rhizoctonia solani TaxID=456999 RepID=A0A8H3D9B2_9AGAM|nr:unnamed protein product [Rhizoctonia solani]